MSKKAPACFAKSSGHVFNHPRREIELKESVLGSDWTSKLLMASLATTVDNTIKMADTVRKHGCQWCMRIRSIQDPPQRAPPTEPRTRRQLAETHPFQLSVTLPRKSNDTILRSFPYGPIAAWNSLPASVVRAAPASKDLQGFKTRAYNHLKRQNWLWATDAL